MNAESGDSSLPSNQQQRTLLLAGTVALPSHFPIAGKIEILDEAVAVGDTKVSALRLEQTLEKSGAIIRTVLLDAVSAIYLPSDEEIEQGQIEYAESRWRVGSSRREAHGSMGIVFVPENAPVLTEAQLGLTAAESADFDPFMHLRSGCDEC